MGIYIGKRKICEVKKVMIYRKKEDFVRSKAPKMRCMHKSGMTPSKAWPICNFFVESKTRNEQERLDSRWI